jgi:hypothetical protein
MATKPVTYCDVFGTVREVKKYSIVLTEIDDNGELVFNTAVPLGTADLCPKAIKRLEGFVHKGINRPNLSKHEKATERKPPAKEPVECVADATPK